MTHRSPYNGIAYQGAVVAATSPVHLSLCSAFHDGPSPQLRSFRVVELGCGDGANLLSLAFYSLNPPSPVSIVPPLTLPPPVKPPTLFASPISVSPSPTFATCAQPSSLPPTM